jgi:hypothetical protein
LKERTSLSNAQPQMFMKSILSTSNKNAHPRLLLLSVWIQMLKLISELDNALNFSKLYKKFNQEMEAVEVVEDNHCKKSFKSS